MNEPEWKVDKQPAWLVAAIKKTITDLDGGYMEAAEWLGVTENALFNRLRADGDQIFPLGWAMVLQRAGGSNHISNAIARHSNGVFVPLADIKDVDNADINQRLMESIEWIGKHSQYLRKATADGVIDQAEREQIEENSYQVMAKWQEHLTLLFRVFCQPERVTPASVQLRASWQINQRVWRNNPHEQFNRKSKITATTYASGDWCCAVSV